MRVTLIDPTFIDGTAHVRGEVVETSDQDARYLIAIGRAVSTVAAERAEAHEAVIATAVPGGKRAGRKK